jgi:transcriptional regulator with GAF, ATPase, and Fis domain
VADDALLVDLLGALSAIGRSMQERFDPRRFLAEFSAPFQRLIPHDRLVIEHLHDDGEHISIFAEHAPPELRLHGGYYTTDFDPGARYTIAQWNLRTAYHGEALVIGDFREDPHYATAEGPASGPREVGLRSALLVPLISGGRLIGVLALTSLTPHLYTAGHVGTARRVAELIAPFVESVYLRERERHRLERLRALRPAIAILADSGDTVHAFAQVTEAARAAFDFDVMMVAVRDDGGQVEIAAASGRADGATCWRTPEEALSFWHAVRSGRTVLVTDATSELDAERAGDRWLLDDGIRAGVIAPLGAGERLSGALLLLKRVPAWYDAVDVDVTSALALHVGMALGHQRLADARRKAAAAEGRARDLEQQLATLSSELAAPYGFDRIIGRAPSLRESLTHAAKAAATEATVLITGESGTGKELVARAIHHVGSRRDRPFVAVNCAALPESLLESELFGHERGAFTGADRQRQGRFELARGGTLFLDEIGELSTGVQAKLLRVLQEREFQRVGGTVTMRADVRILAATNRDVQQAVAEGRFREDLYYRIAVVTITLPALRERGTDVLLLAEHFLETFGAQLGRPGRRFTAAARDSLLSHSWPGNIRELANAVERALIMADGDRLGPEHLGVSMGPARVPARDPDPEPSADVVPAVTSLPALERSVIADVMRRVAGNKARAARMLGVSRSKLYTRLRQLGLDDRSR